MTEELGKIKNKSLEKAIRVLNCFIEKQPLGITEISEKEMTTALERHIASLSDPVTEAEIQTVREDLFRIMELNMAAIRSKSSGVFPSISFTDG